jgi:hypothetical protein
MLTSKPRPSRMIKMRCPAGKLIPKHDTAGQPKWAKFYNWPRDAKGNPIEDSPGFPTAADIPEVVVDVPYDQHHAGLIVKGPCCMVSEVAPAPAPVKPKREKE